jgi:CubicO group peptidase (beta-lactamase class C family)
VELHLLQFRARRALSLLTTLCVAGAIAVCGFSANSLGQDEPPQYSQFCPAAESKDDNWRTGSPSAHGLETAIIEELRRDARAGDLGKLHSVLVVKDGALVVEEYFHGAGRDHCQLIASVTKSLVSILIGTSLEHNPERTVDTPLIDFFPQYADVMKQEGKSAITLAHALTMTAGLDWDEYSYPHPDERNPNTQMYGQADPKRFILSRDQIHPPGAAWAYNSGLSVILGATVRGMTGLSIDKFAEAQLFAPLGIDRYHWFKHADGTVYSNGDLLLTPRDLARIGLLVLNRGEWQGRQIVSRRWIAESTRRHVATQTGLGYGYQWWRGSVVRAGRRIDIVFASGTGGQRLFIVPELNMVAVVTAKVFGNRTGPSAAAGVLADYLIPAALPALGAGQFVQPNETFLDSAVGTYFNSKSKHTVRIVRENESLFLEPDPVPGIGPAPSRIELTAIASKRLQGYWGRIGVIVLDVNTDDNGAVTGGTVNLLLRDRAYRKID